MTFHPEGLGTAALKRMQERLGQALTQAGQDVPVEIVQDMLGHTLGYSRAQGTPWDQAHARAQVHDNPVPHPLHKASTRRHLWQMWHFRMELGVSTYEAFGDIQQDMLDLGEDPTVVALFENWRERMRQNESLSEFIPKDLGKVAPDEAIAFALHCRLTSLQTAVAQLVQRSG